MNKSVADLVIEKQKQYYPNGLPKLEDFKTGDKVKVITPCQDFCFFYEETGVVRSIKGKYLAIDVVFDKPRHFKDGDIQKNFNFNPEDLFKIGEETKCVAHNGICNQAPFVRLSALLGGLPCLSQRQDSLNEQLFDLMQVANRLGMYDAADFIQKEMGKSA